MNFKKLQEMQRALDDAILKEKPEMTAEERFEKTLVALSVEIAELANTAEHFKFWKENKGKIDNKRFIVSSVIVNKITTMCYYDEDNDKYIAKEQAHKLTLVEEASDCLHFILSLANQLIVELYSDENEVHRSHILDFIFNRNNGLEADFLSLIRSVSRLTYSLALIDERNINLILSIFIIYCNELGITQEELEQAYYDKNEINYQRLKEGY